MHEHALLVATSNYILRFEFFQNSLKSSSEKFRYFLENMSKKKIFKSVCVEAGELKFYMNMLYYVLKHDFQVLKIWIFAVDFWKNCQFASLQYVES
jgi:hypothetical protein